MGNRNREIWTSRLPGPAHCHRSAACGPAAPGRQRTGAEVHEVGQHNAAVEWVAVRPDSLTDEDASPTTGFSCRLSAAPSSTLARRAASTWPTSWPS
ncbi:MAG: hypothetical protein R3A10_11445 [Caldilineaceae bacterium]